MRSLKRFINTYNDNYDDFILSLDAGYIGEKMVISAALSMG